MYVGCVPFLLLWDCCRWYNVFLINDALHHPSASHLLLIWMIIFMTKSVVCSLCHNSAVLNSYKCYRWAHLGFEWVLQVMSENTVSKIFAILWVIIISISFVYSIMKIRLLLNQKTAEEGRRMVFFKKRKMAPSFCIKKESWTLSVKNCNSFSKLQCLMADVWQSVPSHWEQKQIMEKVLETQYKLNQMEGIRWLKGLYGYELLNEGLL